MWILSIVDPWCILVNSIRLDLFVFSLLYLIFLVFSFTWTFNMGVWVRAVCFIIGKRTKPLILCFALFWMIRLFYVMRDWPQWFFVSILFSLIRYRPPLLWVWNFTFIAHNVTNDEKKTSCSRIDDYRKLLRILFMTGTSFELLAISSVEFSEK